MKRLSLFALAAAGMLLGACTSGKDEVASEKLNQYDLIEGQSAWISLGIALPGDPVTRANEDLNDGIEEEYKVHTAKLVLFKGANEEEATLIKAYDLTTVWPTDWPKETGDNTPGGGTDPNDYGEVSHTSTKIVKEIDSPKLGGEDNLYGYVILNEGNSEIKYIPETPFSEFKVQVLKAIGILTESQGYGNIDTDKGLVMTNVPIADKYGGVSKPADDTKVTTLAFINKNAVYDTKADAEAGTTVACIYVERAAVKVQVVKAATKIELPYGTHDVYTAVTPAGTENPSTEGWYEKNGDNYEASEDTSVDSGKTYYTKSEAAGTQLSFTFNGWALGNVNHSGTGYYNTRQFDTNWLPYNNLKVSPTYLRWRMVGRTNFFENTHTPAYRTYFGRDVNYTNALDGDGHFAVTDLLNKKLTDGQYTLTDGGCTYTYENTFDENSQIWANTTYVGIKVTIAGGSFYTIDGQPNTMLTFNPSTNEGTLPGEVAKNHSAIISTANTNIQTAIQADLNSSSSTLNAGKADDAKIKYVSFKLNPIITLKTRSATTGEIGYEFTLQLTDVKNRIGDATDYTDMDGADVTKLNTLVSSVLSAVNTGTTKVIEYTDGVTYYSMRIAHFGDVETPWSTSSESYNKYNLIYPENGKSNETPSVEYSDSRASAWLGRWGIVRNNWYKLTIDAIKGLGSPVPEDYSGEAGGTPDDNPEPKYYIAAHVHILPWAVRNQSVKF